MYNIVHCMCLIASVYKQVLHMRLTVTSYYALNNQHLQYEYKSGFKCANITLSWRKAIKPLGHRNYKAAANSIAIGNKVKLYIVNSIACRIH